MKYFGRLLFPKSPPHQQEKSIRELSVAVVLGFVLALTVGLVIYFKNKSAH